MIQELREALKKRTNKKHILGTVPKSGGGVYLNQILKFGNIWKVQTLEFQLSLRGGGFEVSWNSSENIQDFFEGFP